MSSVIPGLPEPSENKVVQFPGRAAQPSANLRKVEAGPAQPDIGVTTFAFVLGPLGIFAMKDNVRVKPDEGLLALAECIGQFHQATKGCARAGASNANDVADNEAASTPGGLL